MDIASDYFISKWPNWLRWVLMVPAAILGSFIVPWIVRIIMSFSEDGESWRIFAEIVQSFMFGLVFVIIAAYTAPKYQLTTAIIFLTVTCLFGGMILMLGLIAQPAGGDKLYTLLHSGLMIAGAALAAVNIKDEIRKNTSSIPIKPQQPTQKATVKQVRNQDMDELEDWDSIKNSD